MKSAFDDNLPIFCADQHPVSKETAIIDNVEYEICSKCGLPIENTGIPLDE